MREVCEKLNKMMQEERGSTNNFDQTLQMREDSAAHENGDLLYDLDTRVTCLPALLALTHGLKEGKECGDTKRRCDDRERTSCGVTHVLIQVVDICMEIVRKRCNGSGEEIYDEETAHLRVQTISKS